MGWLLIIGAFCFWALLSWCLCRVAGRADEQIERIFNPADSAPHRAVAGDDGSDSLSLSSATVLNLDNYRQTRRTP